MTVRYAFEAGRRDALRSGALTATLRALGRKRHVRIGEAVTLLIGARPVATARALCRGKVIVGPTALLRVLEIECAREDESLAVLLRAAEQGQPQAAEALPRLANVLGFESWDALYTYTAAHGLTAEDRLWREVISWAPASLEPVDG